MAITVWVRITATLAGFVLLGLCGVQASAQTPQTASTGDWPVPRTEWGHPDLQGNWTNQWRTPTERRVGHGPTLTGAQVDSIEHAIESRVDEGNSASDPDREPPAAGGNVGGYNEVYYDWGDEVARVHGEPRSSLITFPEDGRIPPLSPSGAQRLAAFHDVRLSFGEADHPEVLTQADRCLVSYGSTLGPPMLPSGGYNSNYTIVQNEDHVLILTEMIHDVRIVKLREPAEVLPSEIRPWFGVSQGHWEGDTLVVETRRINPKQMLSPTFDPSFTSSVVLSDDVRVEERFTRTDEHTLLYEFEVEDPATYSEAWGGQIPMRRFDDLLYEYACHEGNYAIEGILSGARYQEGLDGERR